MLFKIEKHSRILQTKIKSHPQLLQKSANIVLAFALFNTLLYCQDKSEGISDKIKWTHEIQSVLDNQVTAWNNRDIAGYMEGYWKSDSLIFTSGGNIRRGWNETFEKYTTSYNSKEKMGALKFSELEYHRLSSDAAWVLGHWELTRNDDHPHGVFTLVLRKFPDGWKIVHDHTSSSK